MEPIWSPWRMEYILEHKAPGCVFCDKLDAGNDEAEHMLVRGQAAYITLNRYPYTNGHLLIVPYVHVPSLEDLPTATLTEMMLLVNQGLAALRLAMDPHGFNIGVNLGKAAGAGVVLERRHEFHVNHWHGAYHPRDAGSDLSPPARRPGKPVRPDVAGVKAANRRLSTEYTGRYCYNRIA